jgi:hypothetical protein
VAPKPTPPAAPVRPAATWPFQPGIGKPVS